MQFKAAAWLIAVTGICLVAACGGGTAESSSSGSGSTAPNCPQTTVVGGDLFLAQPGAVGVTLQSNGGLSTYTFTFLYDNVFGTSTNNQQDKWGSAVLFGPGTSAGASTQVQVQPNVQGVPIELWLTKNDGNQPGPSNSSSTASINKDLLGHDAWHTASVTYGANATATVVFFPSDPATFSVSLTNVKGAGSPTGPGC